MSAVIHQRTPVSAGLYCFPSASGSVWLRPGPHYYRKEVAPTKGGCRCETPFLEVDCLPKNESAGVKKITGLVLTLVDAVHTNRRRQATPSLPDLPHPLPKGAANVRERGDRGGPTPGVCHRRPRLRQRRGGLPHLPRSTVGTCAPVPGLVSRQRPAEKGGAGRWRRKRWTA